MPGVRCLRRGTNATPKIILLLAICCFCHCSASAADTGDLWSDETYLCNTLNDEELWTTAGVILKSPVGGSVKDLSVGDQLLALIKSKFSDRIGLYIEKALSSYILRLVTNTAGLWNEFKIWLCELEKARNKKKNAISRWKKELDYEEFQKREKHLENEHFKFIVSSTTAFLSAVGVRIGCAYYDPSSVVGLNICGAVGSKVVRPIFFYGAKWVSGAIF